MEQLGLILDPCFACGRKRGNGRHQAHTVDGQNVYVGPECYKLINNRKGYQPKGGGPRLFPGWAD